MGKISSLLNLDTLYPGGGVYVRKSPPPLYIFASNIPYIHTFYIALLSYAIAYM